MTAVKDDNNKRTRVELFIWFDINYLANVYFL